MLTAIHTLELGTMDNLIHIIVDNDSAKAMVVDPAWDAQVIAETIERLGCQLAGILLTHSHYDHWSAVDELLAAKPVPVYLTQREFRLGLARLKAPSYISDGDVLTLGRTRIAVIETPGHTLGSACYLVNSRELITGDTLFIDGCGRCNFLESQVNAMFESLQRLKRLPDEVVVYPGHHYGQKKKDTLGNQKKTNPYLLINDQEFFIQFRMHLQAQYRSIPFAPSSLVEMQQIYQRHHDTTVN